MPKVEQTWCFTSYINTKQHRCSVCWSSGCAREINAPLDILQGRQESCNRVKKSKKLGELGQPGAERLQ